MKTIASYKRGFTLIEVMAAVVVLGIGIASVLALISQSTRAISLARSATVQASLAKLVMVDIENDYWQKNADDIDLSGDFGDDFSDYRYEVVITEDIDEEVPALQQVDVVVFYDGIIPPREYTLTTYFIDFMK